MHLFGDPTIWLPLTFAALMGLSILVYVVLDGFDLGVGILMPFADKDDRDLMVASIGPFWDANETWLVLAIGLLLVAFPAAHGLILTALYLPVAIMLLGLIMRGVAFELRVKAPGPYRKSWNRAFVAGSVMTALSQGFMLGLYIMGLQWRWDSVLFACLVGLCVAAGYAYVGAAWLIMKTSGELQKRAVHWAQRGLLGIVTGFAAISVATPLVSGRIFEKWFSIPEVFLLAPLPLFSLVLVFITWVALKRLPDSKDRYSWIPFASGSALFALAFFGLAYSFYPYVVPEQLTIREASSAPESLFIILIGACMVLPAIVAYTILAYVLFRGKATPLRYD